jgi:hypothetical protein
MSDGQKRPPPIIDILKPGLIMKDGKIQPSIYQNRRHQRIPPISEEDKKAIKAFQEWMKKSPAEREKIRKEKREKEQRRKNLIRHYTTGNTRNTWVANTGTKEKDTNSLKF